MASANFKGEKIKDKKNIVGDNPLRNN